MSMWDKFFVVFISFLFSTLAMIIGSYNPNMESLKQRVTELEQKFCCNNIEVIKSYKKLDHLPKDTNTGFPRVVLTHLEEGKYETYTQQEYESRDTDYKEKFNDGFVARFNIPSDPKVTRIYWEALVCNKKYSVDLDVSEYRRNAD